jgi:hypothetical protein
MARPPRLVADVPTVTADWQWRGEWPVTTPAVMTGAWRLPRENRIVLLFVNVADDPVTAKLELNFADYDLAGAGNRVTRITPDGADPTRAMPLALEQDVTFPPRAAWAWEVVSQ